MHKILFYNKFIVCLYMFRAHGAKIILRCTIRRTSKKLYFYVVKALGIRNNVTVFRHIGNVKVTEI